LCAFFLQLVISCQQHPAKCTFPVVAIIKNQVESVSNSRDTIKMTSHAAGKDSTIVREISKEEFRELANDFLALVPDLTDNKFASRYLEKRDKPGAKQESPFIYRELAINPDKEELQNEEIMTDTAGKVLSIRAKRLTKVRDGVLLKSLHWDDHWFSVYTRLVDPADPLSGIYYPHPRADVYYSLLIVSWNEKVNK
jgi:hypothetical protein